MGTEPPEASISDSGSVPMVPPSGSREDDEIAYNLWVYPCLAV